MLLVRKTVPVSLAAFGAPVGGLLFAMEEVSSFWKNKLSFQVRKAISKNHFYIRKVIF